MKHYGYVRLFLRPRENYCRSKDCKSPEYCLMIDTYDGATGKYIGSFYPHPKDRTEARKILRKERARWRASGFTVLTR
jgi:hypothetical protein